MSTSGYSAPDNYLATLQPVRAPGRVEEAPEFTNPIMEFENIGPEMAKNGVYYSWSTFAKAAKLIGVGLEEMSLDTVRMFAKDATEAGFKL